MIKDLVKVGKKLDSLGLVIGEGGNISARKGDIIYIKRRGAALGKAKISDYIPVNVKNGKPLTRKWRPSSEIFLHLACYDKRDDIGAVIHSHPVFATALGIAKGDLKPITYELAANIKSNIARIGYIKAGTSSLGNAVGKAVRTHNAVLLKNHGLLTVGRDLDEAFMRTLALERAAVTYISCKAAGKLGFLKPKDYKRFFEKL